jgi:hypothetical protein
MARFLIAQIFKAGFKKLANNSGAGAVGCFGKGGWFQRNGNGC